MLLPKQLHHIIFTFTLIFFKIELMSDEVVQFDVEQSLSSIPPAEQEKLFALFDYLFRQHEFSYALYGDKPVAIDAYYFDDFKDNSPLNYCEYILKKTRPFAHYEEGWKIWEIYRQLLKINYYILTSYPFPNTTHARTFILINKKALIEVVENNLTLFKTLLNDPTFNAHTFLLELETGGNFFDAIKRDQELLGILLGFGHHNSHLFKQRDTIRDILESKAEIPYLIQGKNSKEWETLEKQLEELNSQLQVFHPYGIVPMTIQFPGFAAQLDHCETIALREKYNQARQNISHLYNHSNWFHEVIYKLIE
jgi:hypothetical protein